MNRNAFAFQLLTCSALYLVLSPFLGATKTQEQGNETSNYFVPFEALHGLIILGIYLTGSRAGMLTWILVTSGFVFAGVLKPKLILRSIVYALAILLISKLGMFLLTPASLNDTNAFLEPTLSAEGSDTLRWDTIVHGIKMWADNPVFGSGLGVFFATSTSYFGKPTVIHSTPVWVLAEFGLTGFTLLAVISFGFYKSAFLSDLKKTKNACLVIIMTNFLIFGLVHEIFYQRIFWLVIGLCLAVPWSNKTPQAESQS